VNSIKPEIYFLKARLSHTLKNRTLVLINVNSTIGLLREWRDTPLSQKPGFAWAGRAPKPGMG
jgi:hypothetical protein